MPNDTTAIDANTLRALTTQPTRWMTVMRRSSTRKEVLRYVNDWPTFELTEGLFLVAIPVAHVWLADRLASGLFYVKVHDTYDEAEADAIANADLVS